MRKGEFHTFVFHGPMFAQPIAFSFGEIVCRDGFWFCDPRHEVREFPCSTHALSLISLNLTAAASRLVSHPWNLTSIAAVSLSLAFAVPLGALFLSDLVLGLSAWLWST